MSQWVQNTRSAFVLSNRLCRDIATILWKGVAGLLEFLAQENSGRCQPVSKTEEFYNQHLRDSYYLKKKRLPNGNYPF